MAQAKRDESDDGIVIKITPCARSGLIIAGFVFGIPTIMLFIGLYATGMYYLALRLGFAEPAAGLMSVFTAIGLLAGTIISTIFRMCEGRWPWSPK